MQDVVRFLDFIFLPVASNDNDDLLALPHPSFDLAIIRELKREMRDENAENGLLLRSRKQRRFFQEVVDAERYIVMRYFSNSTPELLLRQLKRHILDNYLSPKRRRKKLQPA